MDDNFLGCVRGTERAYNLVSIFNRDDFQNNFQLLCHDLIAGFDCNTVTLLINFMRAKKKCQFEIDISLNVRWAWIIYLTPINNVAVFRKVIRNSTLELWKVQWMLGKRLCNQILKRFTFGLDRSSSCWKRLKSFRINLFALLKMITEQKRGQKTLFKQRMKSDGEY